MRLPRWVHQAYAAVGGYFWAPCPLCGQYFGGHQWRDRNGLSSVISNGPGFGNRGICPTCTLAGLGGQ